MALRWPWRRGNRTGPTAQQSEVDTVEPMPDGEWRLVPPLTPTVSDTAPLTVEPANPVVTRQMVAPGEPLSVQSTRELTLLTALATFGRRPLQWPYPDGRASRELVVASAGAPDDPVGETVTWAEADQEPVATPRIDPVRADVDTEDHPETGDDIGTESSAEVGDEPWEVPAGEEPAPRREVPTHAARDLAPPLTVAGPEWVSEARVPDRPWAPVGLLRGIYREQDRELARIYGELNGEERPAAEPARTADQPASAAEPAAPEPTEPEPEPEATAPQATAPEPVAPGPGPGPGVRRASLAESRRRGIGVPPPAPEPDPPAAVEQTAGERGVDDTGQDATDAAQEPPDALPAVAAHQPPDRPAPPHTTESPEPVSPPAVRSPVPVDVPAPQEDLVPAPVELVDSAPRSLPSTRPEEIDPDEPDTDEPWFPELTHPPARAVDQDDYTVEPATLDHPHDTDETIDPSTDAAGPDIEPSQAIEAPHADPPDVEEVAPAPPDEPLPMPTITVVTAPLPTVADQHPRDIPVVVASGEVYPPLGHIQLAPGDDPAPPTRELSLVDTSVPATLTASLSQALRTDVTALPVRRGGAVDAVARQLGARAFTAGGVAHVPDQVGPLDGREAAPLLAHELTHVVQQQRFGNAPPVPGSERDSQLEAEAVAVERWVESGSSGPPPPVVAHGTPPPDPLDEWNAATATPGGTRPIAEWHADTVPSDDQDDAAGSLPGAFPGLPQYAPADPLDEWAAATTAPDLTPTAGAALPDPTQLSPGIPAPDPLDEWNAAAGDASGPAGRPIASWTADRPLAEDWAAQSTQDTSGIPQPDPLAEWHAAPILDQNATPTQHTGPTADWTTEANPEAALTQHTPMSPRPDPLAEWHAAPILDQNTAPTQQTGPTVDWTVEANPEAQSTQDTPASPQPDPLAEWHAAPMPDQRAGPAADWATEGNPRTNPDLSQFAPGSPPPDPLAEWHAAAMPDDQDRPQPSGGGLLAAFQGMRSMAAAQEPAPHPYQYENVDAPPPIPPKPPTTGGGGGGGGGGADQEATGPPPESTTPSVDELMDLLAEDPPRRWLDLDDPDDFEEISNRLYHHVIGRLRFDVIVERERSGTLLDNS
jgi:uncharacterized protein DUF4157